MRLFVAVDLPAPAGAAVAAAAAGLRASFPSLRWSLPEDYHLTLAFLGETAPARLPVVLAAMERAARAAPFEAALGAPGAFPSWEAPRVLWLGLKAGEAPLAALAGSLRKELQEDGFVLETREFRAHLTVARAKVGMREDGLRERFERTFRVLEPRAWRVEELTLYESLRPEAGARYKVIARRILEV